MEKIDLPTLARKLLPFLKDLLKTSDGTSVVGGAPSPHGLNSTHHSGTLANSQAPQFLLTNGSRPLTGNLTVSAGVTIDGVDLSVHAADPNAHHNAVTVAGGLILAGQQLTVGVGNGTALSGTSVIVDLAANSGLTFSGGDLTLGTPGTATVSSSNAVSTSTHTHAVTSSSNPGAAASLLASDASGYLQLTRLGLGVAPTVPIQARATTEQLRLDYDVSNYAAFTVGSGGNLTVAPTGDFVFDPAGNDVLPNTGYDLNLGSLTKKYLTLHAAELWVETLVAQNTLATIGGRILVGPTTSLIEDVNSLSLAIKVKHNQMSSGDRVYLEANGSVEFMAITSGPSVVAGGYQYSVTRDLDGSGINNWYAGDAVFNTGQAGDGFIDLYSVQGVSAGSSAGPTIVGNVRNSSTYNDWTEHWAIGNLNGLYGYGTDTYGVGLGKFGAGSENYVTFDATNGVRFFEGSTVQAQLSGSVWTLGVTSADHVRITSSGVQLKDSSVVKLDMQTDGDVFLGSDVTSPASTYLSIFSGTQTYNSESMGAGDMLIGDNSASKANILWDKSAGQLLLRGGTTNLVTIDGTGIYLASGTATSNKLRWLSGSNQVLEYYANFTAGGGTNALMQATGVSGSNNNASVDIRGYNAPDDKAASMFVETSTPAAGFYAGAADFATGILFTLNYATSRAQFNGANLVLSDGYSAFINDTVNTGMTTGLTINQGAADDEVLARKSSDVAHGMTAISETDTYGYDSKHSATEGGLKLVGLSEGTVGLSLFGLYTNDDTTRSTAAVGGVQVDSRKKSGTTTGSPGANANLFVVRSNGNARFLVDQEGDIHMDATSNINAWDEHDDIQLLAGVREAMNPGLRLAEFVEEARPVLERTGVVTYNPDGHHFISLKKMHALEIDAMRQLHQRIERLEKELEALR